MNEEYKGKEAWTWEEISAKSKEIQQKENLLFTSFQFSDADQPETEIELISWDTWGIWALLSLLSTLFLADWVIREKALKVSTRFLFMNVSRVSYHVQSIFLYIALFIFFDLISLILFTMYLDIHFTYSFLLCLLSYRLMISMLAITLAHWFQKNAPYYGFSILFILIVSIISGIIIPIHGFGLQSGPMRILNPMHAFLGEDITLFWLFISLTLLLFTLIRKEKSNA